MLVSKKKVQRKNKVKKGRFVCGLKTYLDKITIILKRMKTCILNCGYVLYVKGVSVLCGGLYIVGYIFSLGNNQKYQQLSSDTKSVQVVKIETIFVPSD